EGRHQKGRVLARGELVDGGFRALARRLRLGVHALAQGARVVQVRGLLEAQRRDAQRADVVLARESDRPAVAPGHVDDLAIHAELLEVARRPAGPLGDLLAGAQHPDRHRERLRSDIDLKLPISRLDVDHGRRLPVQPTTLSRLASDGEACLRWRGPSPRSREIVCNGCRIRSAPGADHYQGRIHMQSPSASYSLTVRLEITNKPGMLGQVTSAIGKAGGDIGAIDLVQVGKSTITRDLTFKARDEKHGQQIVDRIRGVRAVKVVNVSDRTFLMHLGGKIEVKGKMSVKTRDDLSMAYTPGVARVCMAIHHDPQKAYALTIKQNCV